MKRARPRAAETDPHDVGDDTAQDPLGFGEESGRSPYVRRVSGGPEEHDRRPNAQDQVVG